MSVPKGKRTKSREEFDSLHYRIHDDAVDMIEHNFRAKPEIAEQNQSYIHSASKMLMSLVFDLVYHIKVANSLYPITHEELTERRIEQDKAIGVCFDIMTLYELVMHKLKVKDDMGVTEIRNVNHQVNSIKKWRSSDNKRFQNLR